MILERRRAAAAAAERSIGTTRYFEPHGLGVHCHGAAENTDAKVIRQFCHIRILIRVRSPRLPRPLWTTHGDDSLRCWIDVTSPRRFLFDGKHLIPIEREPRLAN